jgi:hypothetical protein
LSKEHLGDNTRQAYSRLTLLPSRKASTDA